ncbi:MAG: hypothetical protein JKY48_10475 [Flavobacteriales bacterium]|nr:hypothetical protein [Flavobacteriales bacterium]
MTETMYTTPLANKSLALLLWALLALFCFRVMAQLIQFFYPLAFLPSFTSWHSGKMPYGFLVLVQLVIIYYCYNAASGIHRATTKPNRMLAKFLLGLGSLYLLTMIFRVSLGLTLLAENRWFSNHIPTFFHFVLATFMLVTSSYHFQSPGKEKA